MALSGQVRRVLPAVAAAGAVVASVLTSPVASGAPASPPGALTPASVTAPETTYAVIKTVGVGQAPTGVAMNSADDTVYVANYSSGNVSVVDGRLGVLTDDTIPVGPGSGNQPLNVAVNQADDTVYITTEINLAYVLIVDGRTGVLDDTVPVPVGSGSVAVNQVDDTVYVARRGILGSGTTMAIIDGRSQSLASTITVGQGPFGVAVNDDDDSVYVANYGSDGTPSSDISVIDGLTGLLANTLTGTARPTRVAVDQDDDTVYVTNRVANTISVIRGATDSIIGTIPVGLAPESVAVDPVDDTVFVVNRGSNNVSVINGRTGVRTDDTIGVGSSPYGVVVDEAGFNAGLIFVSNAGAGTLSVIGRVTPSAPPASGFADDTFTMTLTVPNLAPGYVMDDATVTSVSFGGTSAGVTRGAGNTWTVTVPAGTIGSTVPVTVTFNGGLTASAGDFTYSALPECALSSFTSDDSCTVAAGETVAFTVVSGAGGSGGVGGAGGNGGIGYQCTPANGGVGEGGGIGGLGGAGLLVSGTYTNATGSAVTLDVLVGANGANGAVGGPGSAGANGTFLSQTGGNGTDGTDGSDGQDGAASGIAVSGGSTIVTAGGGLKGTKGLKGTGGTGGAPSPGCTAGTNGTRGANGTAGTLGTLVAPGSLPSGWASAPGTGSPRVVFTAPTPPGPNPLVPPSAPRNVVAEPGDGSATVSWDPPADPGSFPVTNYRVIAAPGGASCLVSAPVTSCVIEGLINGQPYTFRVEALNGAGWGPLSAATDPVTPGRQITVPGPVRDIEVVRVTAGGTVVLRWRTPAFDGGSPVIAYRVGQRLVAEDAYTRVIPNPTSTRVRITGLIPGRAYWVRIRAGNVAGFGPGTRYAERIRIPLA